MNQSEKVDQLLPALAEARKEFRHAEHDGNNPHHHYTYSTLAAIQDAAEPALQKHGLLMLQPATTDGRKVTVVSYLFHVASGQFFSEPFAITAKEDTPQGLGAACTYARKYGYAALAGVVTDEDADADKSSRARAREPRPEREEVSRGTDEQGLVILAKLKAAKTMAELNEVKREMQKLRWEGGIKEQLYKAGEDAKKAITTRKLPEDAPAADVAVPVKLAPEAIEKADNELRAITAAISESPDLVALGKLVPRCRALQVPGLEQHYKDALKAYQEKKKELERAAQPASPAA